MTNRLYTIKGLNLDSFSDLNTEEALLALESGQVIFLPDLAFPLLPTESNMYEDLTLDGKHKNISYNIQKKTLGGLSKKSSVSENALLEQFMYRFTQFSKELVHRLLPHYQENLEWGRTSYRPIEIKGRKSSKRKDDTRLHVDSFPATPVNGKRILRIFSNINPYNEPRVWLLGEPFETVVDKFIDSLPAYNPFYAKVLNAVKATKSLRTSYDHYMLHLHDAMKLDDKYQQTVKKDQIDFPAQSTWIVFTDHVSHAALSGRHLLEQTFYLPTSKMKYMEKSPMHVLSESLKKELVW